jgi:hypothetical protein
MRSVHRYRSRDASLKGGGQCDVWLAAATRDAWFRLLSPFFLNAFDFNTSEQGYPRFQRRSFLNLFDYAEALLMNRTKC